MPKISKRGLGNRLITQKAHPADLRAGPFCWLLAVGESGIVKHFFHTATRTHPAPMVWFPSKGPWDLEWLILVFILLRVKLQTLN